MSRRGILLTLTAALLVTSLAYLVVRSSSEDGDAVATAEVEDDPTTGTSRATTTTRGATSSTASTLATTTTVTMTTSPPAPRPTAPSAPTTEPAPPFQSSIGPVTAEELGASYTPGIGCTPPEQLSALELSHWGYDGRVHTGRLIVDAGQAERVVAAFRDVYAARFPIERMEPVSAYGGDDDASMRANNTSGYNCRTVAGSPRLSNHAFGRAVDINPLVNPYVRGGTVDPPEGAPYADRDAAAPGMIQPGDPVVQAFARQGWEWGGYWSSGPDYQHFSENGG